MRHGEILLTSGDIQQIAFLEDGDDIADVDRNVAIVFDKATAPNGTGSTGALQSQVSQNSTDIEALQQASNNNLLFQTTDW